MTDETRSELLATSTVLYISAIVQRLVTSNWGLIDAAIFWCICGVAGICYFIGSPGIRKIIAALMATGLVMNALVTLSNGGRMPVIGWKPANGPLTGMWQKATDNMHYLILCDRHNLGNFGIYSIGDVFVASAGLFAILLYAGEKIWNQVQQKRRLKQTIKSLLSE